jgi:hypothetical protein
VKTDVNSRIKLEIFNLNCGGRITTLVIRMIMFRERIVSEEIVMLEL